MPFAGDAAARSEAIAALERLATREDDELILVDNRGAAPAEAGAGRVRIVGATAPASSYYARNVRAEHAASDWLLFLDADCVPEPGLLDAYFRPPPGDRVGAVVGAVEAAPAGGVLAEYARSRGMLDRGVNLRIASRPFAVTANLLVRRGAWEALGGFQEGVRSGADGEF